MLPRIRSSVREGLWAVPTALVVGAVTLALGLLAVDRRVGSDAALSFGGGAEGARALLGAIAGSMITLTGLVFSITVVVLQLAANQYSPRVLRSFLRDLPSKLALGLFVATFTYSLVVLREVRELPDGDRVPGVAVTGALVLVAASVVVFVVYIHHIAQSIRVTSVLARVADETWRSIEAQTSADRVVEPTWAPPTEGTPRHDVHAERGGYLTAIDVAGLVALASGADLRIEVVPAIGDFVPRSAVIVRISGRRADDDFAVALRRALPVGDRSSDRDDIAFGLRQLADIAARALSPGVNDPTTAVQALDHVHDLLRGLCARELPGSVQCDDAGVPRLRMSVPTWPALLHIGTVEARHAGAGSVAVTRRLRALHEDLAGITRDDRLRAVLDELRELDLAVDEQYASPGDRALARVADVQGLGAAARAPAPPT